MFSAAALPEIILNSSFVSFVITSDTHFTLCDTMP